MSFITDGKLIKTDGRLNERHTTVPNEEKSLTHEDLEVALNPEVMSFVDRYIKREIDDLTSMKDWGKPYLDLYDKILAEYHLPIELKYLSVVESSLQSGLISSAGAVGPWQLMADEAKRYGLKRGNGIDERKNFLKSTVAASKLLKSLYKEFGDWVLVIAAYNAGEGRMKQAIKRAGSKDFWDLQEFLPLETRAHVKKYMATHYFFEGQGSMTTMTAKETRKYNKELLSHNAYRTATGTVLRTSTTRLSGKFNSSAITEALSIDKTLFNKLNPDFDKRITAGQPYELRLPKEKMRIFEEKKKEILSESMNLPTDSLRQSSKDQIASTKR